LSSSYSSFRAVQDRSVVLVDEISPELLTFYRDCRDCSGFLPILADPLSQTTRQTIDDMRLMAMSDLAEGWPSMAIGLQFTTLKSTFTVKSTFIKPSQQLRSMTREVSDPREEFESSAYGLVQGGLGHAYNEEAFHYFLEIERKRAQRSGRPFLLLLADLKNEPGKSALVGGPLASKLFASLWLCLRETDFVGWYREDRVAGAVLTQRAELRSVEISQQVLERITRMLDERLPRDVAARLQVRIYQPPDMLSGRWQ
jgi:hypothetical protein